MATCKGTAEAHCCWLLGEVCPHFVGGNDDPMNGCGLRRELGSWAAVHADPRWIADVKTKLDQRFPGQEMNCGDWPRPGETCATCGACD